MADKTLYQWNVWCNDEAKYYTTWAAKPPTVCPVDAVHTADANKLKILDRIVDASINAYIEERAKESTTGGMYAAGTWDFPIPAEVGWHEKDFSFPFGVDLLSAEWANAANNQGDEVEVQLGPDTPIGPITADVAADVDIIPLYAAAIAAVKVGYKIKLTDGVNTDELGYILSIDDVANTVKVQAKTVNAFVAATPTQALVHRPLVPHGYLHNATRVQLGEEKIGGSFLEANKIARVRYKNVDGAADKKLIIWVKYLY